MSARPLFGLLDVGVDQQAVHLGVDVLHGDLEAVEAPGLCHLHFLRKALHLVATTTRTSTPELTPESHYKWMQRCPHQVLVDDAVAGGEEGQHVRDEVALVVLQRLPVLQVFGQVHLGTQNSSQAQWMEEGLGSPDRKCWGVM